METPDLTHIAYRGPMPNGATTTQRGYGSDHQAEKKRWAKIIKREGYALCHATTCLHPTRTILDGQPFDLGHTEDRTAWTGPEHPRCNRTEGAVRGNRARRTTKPEPDRWVI